MTPIRYIRLVVFDGLSQREFATLIGRRQATISDWETGRADVRLEDLRAIRALAKRRHLPWRDDMPFMSERFLEKAAEKFSKAC